MTRVAVTKLMAQGAESVGQAIGNLFKLESYERLYNSSVRLVAQSERNRLVIPATGLYLMGLWMDWRHIRHHFRIDRTKELMLPVDVKALEERDAAV